MRNPRFTLAVATDALGGFAAHLSTRKARDLAADPRVQSVVANGDSSGG